MTASFLETGTAPCGCNREDLGVVYIESICPGHAQLEQAPWYIAQDVVDTLQYIDTWSDEPAPEYEPEPLLVRIRDSWETETIALRFQGPAGAKRAQELAEKLAVIAQSMLESGHAQGQIEVEP